MRLQPLRTLIILVTLVVAASTLLSVPVASAQGPTRDFGSESGFLASVNSQRAAGGLAPLTLSSSMTAAADGWTLSMANGSFLAHASDIVSGTPGGWTKVGENVGRGQSVASLTSAFMASPGHRANIMDASYTHIGIAVYNHPSDGRMYTTHRFAALPGAAPAAPAPAAPTATPIPTAVPAPPTPIPTAVPAPPTPVPATPVPTPIPATPVPATPVPTSPPAPTATPIPPLVTTPEPEPTPIPPTPVPTQIPATATPEPTAVPATAVPATAVPATTVPAATVPATPTPVDDAASEETPESDFGTPPEQLAFVDVDAFEEAASAKLASKMAKFSS